MATLVTARFDNGHEDRYFLPLAMSSGPGADEDLLHSPDGIVARIAGAAKGVLHGSLDADIARELFAVIAETRTVEMRHGQLAASRTPAFEEVRAQAPEADLTPGQTSTERANSTTRFGERYVLKLVRRIWPGPSHEVEMGRFLTERAHFTRAPRLAGTIDVTSATGDTAAVALLHAFVPHQMDAWRQALSELERYFESAVAWDVGQAHVNRVLQLAGAVDTGSRPADGRGRVGVRLDARPADRRAAPHARRRRRARRSSGRRRSMPRGSTRSPRARDAKPRRRWRRSPPPTVQARVVAVLIDTLLASRDRLLLAIEALRAANSHRLAAHAHSRRLRSRAGASQRSGLRDHRLRRRSHAADGRTAAPQHAAARRRDDGAVIPVRGRGRAVGAPADRAAGLRTHVGLGALVAHAGRPPASWRRIKLPRPAPRSWQPIRTVSTR